ncbi:MAG: class IV adenylate cyclase [Candidatus Bathyarchaeota archaeon]|nr:class IV adenylate cyclase [Candidatus Bathyarchaeota archaeon]
MVHVNIEVKARCADPAQVRRVLRSQNAVFIGTDHQVDTYFNVSHGWLKLREGAIENFLIFYDREDEKGPKQSNVILFKPDPDSSIKEILVRSLGVLVVVDKRREIFFIDNVKFHVDAVKDLGNFVEIMAIDKDGAIGGDKLHEQCQRYLEMLKVPKEELVSVSYSDLLLDRDSRLKI